MTNENNDTCKVMDMSQEEILNHYQKLMDGARHNLIATKDGRNSSGFYEMATLLEDKPIRYSDGTAGFEA